MEALAPGPARGAPDLDLDFYLYSFKVLPCTRGRRGHDWAKCPFAHPGEKAARRDLRTHYYQSHMCPHLRQVGGCPRGDACEYAHSVFEYWLHPARFRTQLCAFGENCKRNVCFFAHSVEQLRLPGMLPAAAPAADPLLGVSLPACQAQPAAGGSNASSRRSSMESEAVVTMLGMGSGCGCGASTRLQQHQQLLLRSGSLGAVTHQLNTPIPFSGSIISGSNSSVEADTAVGGRLLQPQVASASTMMDRLVLAPPSWKVSEPLTLQAAMSPVFSGDDLWSGAAALSHEQVGLPMPLPLHMNGRATAAEPAASPPLPKDLFATELAAAAAVGQQQEQTIQQQQDTIQTLVALLDAALARQNYAH